VWSVKLFLRVFKPSFVHHASPPIIHRNGLLRNPFQAAGQRFFAEPFRRP